MPGAASSTTDGLSPVFAAARAQFGLVLLLWLLAAAGWWWSGTQMAGMDNGPWTAFGPAGWFLAAWVVMMAAMMLPSVAPTIALYGRMMRRRSPLLPLLFACGYLVVWAAAGVVAYLLAATITAVTGDALTWERMGRPLAGIALITAALYQLTPLKHACLEKCRSPLGQLLGSWRDGWLGAIRMGGRNGAWCVGCCWMLMMALFALGIMSVTWMALIAGVIAVEKLLPQRRLAAYGIAGLLLALGVLLLAVPQIVPGLTLPSRALTMPMT